MQHAAIPYHLTLAALAATALLAACGGGEAEPPPGSQDTTAPTLVISDNVSAAKATGAVTFTFTFSEPVTGFTADDVNVTGGSKGDFIMGSTNTTATLVVAPTAASTGTVQIGVAAGAFADFAGNANAAPYSADQVYDTTPPPPSGNTGTCTTATCIHFSEANVGLIDFGGLGVAVTADPVDATNMVAQLTKDDADPTWAGATVHLGSGDFTVTRIDPAQGITLRVYSPAVGETVMIKIEDGANVGVFVEASATTTKASEWETLTFSYPGANASATYNKVSVFPAFGTQANKVFYVDELKYVAKAADVKPSALTFSSGFASNVSTANNGLVTSAGGSDLDGWNCNGTPTWCGSGSGGTGADSYMYSYYQTPSPATGLYSQIEVFGPDVASLSTTGDTGGVTLTNQTKVNFTFNPNPEWYSSTNNKFAVVITLGKRYAIDGGCHLQLHGVKAPTSADATGYSMTLASEFRVAADCGTGIAPTDVAAALAASPVVSSVKFLGAGGGAAITGRDGASSGANLSVATGSGVYPTTVALKGAITFD